MMDGGSRYCLPALRITVYAHFAPAIASQAAPHKNAGKLSALRRDSVRSAWNYQLTAIATSELRL